MYKTICDNPQRRVQCVTWKEWPMQNLTEKNSWIKGEISQPCALTLNCLSFNLILWGTGLNCTKTKMHEWTELLEAKFARVNKIARGNKIALRRFCTKGQFCTSYIFSREIKKKITIKKFKKLFKKKYRPRVRG